MFDSQASMVSDICCCSSPDGISPGVVPAVAGSVGGGGGGGVRSIVGMSPASVGTESKHANAIAAKKRFMGVSPSNLGCKVSYIGRE